MANLAQLDLTPRGRESQIRALLGDVVDYHKDVYPNSPLALVVWYAKDPGAGEQQLLELFDQIHMHSGLDFGVSRFSLYWRTGSNSPPFVNIRATSVGLFSMLLSQQPGKVAPFRERFEVLYFDKDVLNPEILDAFRIVTEPPGLIRGWYISEAEYEKSKGNVQALLGAWGRVAPHVGLVKIEESADFEYCRGILHVQVGQKWIPISPEAIKPYTYYNDKQEGKRVRFLLEGGALYEVVRFEVKTAPDYPKNLKLLGKTPDDRYPEVHLRAVHAPA